MNTVNLSPCPFCGLTDQDAIAPEIAPDMGQAPAVAMHSYPGGHRIECEGCDCNGPWRHYPAEAITAWNNRVGELALRSVATDLRTGLIELLDTIAGLIPPANCACHLAPPCSDCVDFAAIRVSVANAKKSLTTLYTETDSRLNEPAS